MGTNVNKYMLGETISILTIESSKYGVFNIIFDSDDYDKIKKFKWRLLPSKSPGTYYVISGSRKNRYYYTV